MYLATLVINYISGILLFILLYIRHHKIQKKEAIPSFFMRSMIVLLVIFFVSGIAFMVFRNFPIE